MEKKKRKIWISTDIYICNIDLEYKNLDQDQDSIIYTNRLSLSTSNWSIYDWIANKSRLLGLI